MLKYNLKNDTPGVKIGQKYYPKICSTRNVMCDSDSDNIKTGITIEWTTKHIDPLYVI